MSPALAAQVACVAELVGWGLASAAVLLGLALPARPPPATSRRVADAHTLSGGLAVLFVAVHLGALYADERWSWLDLALPLASSWQPVALGVVALWLLTAVALTMALRRHLPAATWRRVHRLSQPLWALITLRLVTAGGHAGDPVVRWLVFLVTSGVAFGLLARRVPGRRSRST